MAELERAGVDAVLWASAWATWAGSSMSRLPRSDLGFQPRSPRSSRWRPTALTGVRYGLPYPLLNPDEASIVPAPGS